jgi:hypothetical protein
MLSRGAKNAATAIPTSGNRFATRKASRRAKRLLLVSPAGSGKTVMAAIVIDSRRNS